MNKETALRPTPDTLLHQLPSLVEAYLKLPNYQDVPGLEDKQDAIQTIADPAVESYLTFYRSNAWAAARSRDYPIAIDIAEKALNELHDQHFTDHDKTAIRILMQRRLGRIYEHWANFGDEKLPLTDKRRQCHFLQATYYYLKADVELGGITEFARRISESFGGAGNHELQAIFAQAFDGPNIQMIHPTPEIMAKLLSNLQKMGEESSGAGKDTYWG